MKQKNDLSMTTLLIGLLLITLYCLTSCKESKLLHYYDEDARQYFKNKNDIDCCAESDNSYRLKIHNDTMYLFDGNREVGKVVTDWKSALDSMILNDNQ